MSIPRYDSYRDSGVEWVGQMPTHWDVRPLLAMANECDRSNKGMIEDNLLSLSYGSIIRKDISASDGLLPESFETYQIVHSGDIVWRLTDLQNDKRSLRTAIVRERGIITSAYLATHPHGISASFLSYQLRGYDQTKVFYSMGGGLRQSLRYADVRRLPILVPSATEQAAIAAFLDRETAKIDALAEEQRRLIDLLKEKRQTVISHAVTKGLDLLVPMKSSGAEWLGEVPAHWQVRRLRFVCDIGTGDADTADSREGGDYPLFVRSPNIEAINHYTHDGEAVLTAGDGAGVGKVFHHYEGKFCAHQRVYIFTEFRDVRGRFFFYYLRENFFKVALEGGAKSTVDSLRRPMIANFWMTLPPDEEQVAILEHIEVMSAQYERMIEAASTAIGLLQERRSALISAAVTGKINVSGQEAQSPARRTGADLRLVVGANIIGALATKPNFGRVKFQKLTYLAQVHVGISEIKGEYLREAAGPLDRALVDDIERRLASAGYVIVSQPDGVGGQVRYRLRGDPDDHSFDAEEALGPRAVDLRTLIDLFADLDTRATEAVTTLYAVWNDALIDGRQPTSAEIVSEVLNSWHPEKAEKFRAAQLETWLAWMQRHGLTPAGRGPRTEHGRLFA